MSQKSDAIKDLPSLEKRNSHPRDGDIQFFEEGHIYDVRGDRTYTSSTTFIHQFFETFNADEVIAGMRSRRTWATSEYNGMTDDEIKAKWEANGKQASELGTKMHACKDIFVVLP